MNNDPRKQARQALQPAGSSGVQAAKPFDAAKGAQLLARVETVIKAPPIQTLVAAPPPPPQAERVKLPMTCSEHGGSYVVEAERRGDELRFIGHEIPPSGPGGAPRLPGRLSGKYRIEASGWACPLCGNADAVWQCECERMKGAMHCHGNSNGQYRCACGLSEAREFVKVKTMAVHGASVAVTSDVKQPGSQQRGQSLSKQVTYERNR